MHGQICHASNLNQKLHLLAKKYWFVHCSPVVPLFVISIHCAEIIFMRDTILVSFASLKNAEMCLRNKLKFDLILSVKKRTFGQLLQDNKQIIFKFSQFPFENNTLSVNIGFLNSSLAASVHVLTQVHAIISDTLSNLQKVNH